MCYLPPGVEIRKASNDPEIGLHMRLRPRGSSDQEHAYTPTTARDVWSAYFHARDHWASCKQCRNTAQASGSKWCEVGLRLMKEGVATNGHWDTCRPCKEAQASIRSAQCSRGRELDDEYRILSQRLAGLQQVD